MAIGDTLALFHPHNNEPPATAGAYISSRNNRPILMFNASVSTYAYFSYVLPQYYMGNGLAVYIYYSDDGNTGAVRWNAAFERIGDQQLDIDGDSFDAQSICISAVPGTSGHVKRAVLSFDSDSIDSLASGESFRLQIERDGNSDGDTSTGVAGLHYVEVRDVIITTESILDDDFDDNSKGSQWVERTPSAATYYINETNQRIEMGLTSPTGANHLQFTTWQRVWIRGDFDAIVDYTLVTAPSTHYWGLWLDLGDHKWAGSKPNEEVRTSREYDTVSGGSIYGGEIRTGGLPELLDRTGSYVATSDTSGKLRVTRVSTTANTYYWNGDSWVLIESGSIGTVDVNLMFWLYTSGAPDIEVTLDNLVVVADSYVDLRN